MLIVQKYGGTSIADTARLTAAAQRVAQLSRQGAQVVVVVSAQGDTTDDMIEKAMQLNRRGSAREMDAYLAAGEQMSAGLMAMAIGALGVPAVLSVYFDVFSGFVQALVFTLLSMVYIAGACPPPETQA